MERSGNGFQFRLIGGIFLKAERVFFQFADNLIDFIKKDSQVFF